MPQPTAVKRSKGERRPSRVNYSEPELPATTAGLKPPTGLSGAGKREWLRLVPMLTKAGVLRDSDALCLEDCCRCLSELRAAEKAFKKAGIATEDGQKLQSIVLKLRSQANTLRRELGLSPSSRSAIRVSVRPDEPKDKNVAQYLRAIPGGKK